MTQEMSAEVNEATRGQQKKDKNMAVVLICIVVMFILCQSLKIIPDIFEAFFCDHSNDISTCQSPFSLEILISVSHLMLAVNSASNFLIYMLRGDKFRQFFFQIFFRCQCTRASRRSKEANRLVRTPHFVFTIEPTFYVFQVQKFYCPLQIFDYQNLLSNHRRSRRDKSFHLTRFCQIKMYYVNVFPQNKKFGL